MIAALFHFSSGDFWVPAISARFSSWLSWSGTEMAVCTLTFPENDPVIAGIGSPPFLIYRCLILDVGENRRDYLPRTAKCQPELSELHRDTAPVEMRSVTLSFYRQNPSSLTLRPRTNTRQADHSFELTHSMLGGRKPESVSTMPIADRAGRAAS